ncbi:hypothetical protein OIU34_39050 [Pararhizobium sp. BT-229]|uniref:hypothetical protein n=1 Tax=Pararhizobium sp. BT-229 TaxID=2986923 RepID=UPI0021F7309B|nr:hypothetical protein [Pararhizobium sp. BT-229]MCV9967808.1 hypothetical protein [Pararhizobium sp. BT-229]
MLLPKPREQSALSLLNLLYLEDDEADAVIKAVRRWCADNGCEMGSEAGSQALSSAVRLVKSEGGSGPGLKNALAREMAMVAPARRLGPVMIVEDEALIALDLEWQLEHSGFETASFSTCAEAKLWLAHNKPAFAILDVQLKEGPCIELAEALVAHDVSFIVSSGLQFEDLPAPFRNGILVKKPCDPAKLSAAFKRCIRPELSRSDMMNSSGKRITSRRPRGNSSWGDFEQSKAYAEAHQRDERNSRQQKTECLRALRQARDSGSEAKN